MIAACATPSAVAAKGATSTIPIIFAVGGDPVKFGLVKSLARPDGNATGINFFTTALGQKRLGLLHELVAKGAVIGFLANPSNPNTTRDTEEAQAAAEQLGHKLVTVKASTVAEIDTAFATLVQANVGGLVVDADAFFVARRVQITTLAARHGIPAIHPSDEFVAVGGLMSYASSIPDAYRSMGNYTARVLKGAKLADLPVLQPTKLELAISLSTAKALALTIPPGVLAIADEVIELGGASSSRLWVELLPPGRSRYARSGRHCRSSPSSTLGRPRRPWGLLLRFVKASTKPATSRAKT